MTRRRRPNQALIILAGTGALVGLDMVAWLLWAMWHVLPWLLAAAGMWGCYKVGQRRGAGRVARTALRGHVIRDDTELVRLRDENSAMRKKIQILSGMVNGPEVRP